MASVVQTSRRSMVAALLGVVSIAIAVDSIHASAATNASTRQNLVLGAWGSGPFENDTALDFLLEIEDKPNAGIKKALRAVVDEKGYLESDEGEQGVAAAALLAAASKSKSSGDPNADDWLAEHPLKTSSKRLALAREALEKIGTTGELLDLWNESFDDNGAEEFRAVLDALLADLR